MSVKRISKNTKKREQFPAEPYVPKFQKKQSTKIKRRALNELENPNVIMMLGGEPQYIHSTEAYFRAGLKTAEEQMLIHLDALVEEQQSLMRIKIAEINNIWKIKLQKAFGDVLPTFSDFKQFWEAHITQNPHPNEFMSKLAQLAKLKEAKVKLAVLKQKKDKARQSVKNGFNNQHTELSAKALEDKLSMFDFRVGLSKNQKTYTYGGEGKKLESAWEEIVKSSTEEVIKWLFNNQQFIHITDSLIDAQIEAYKNNKKDNLKLEHTQIGKIFEHMTEGVYKNVINNPKFNDKVVPLVADLAFQRVAAEQEGSGKSTTTYKADTNVQFINNISGEVILEFLTSDKTGQSVDFSQNKIDLETKNVDQFTATIESKTFDFSQLGLNINAYERNKQMIDNLIQYVLANGYAFSGRVSIVNFKELIVMFLAWMKVVSEIIGGESSMNDTPLAIRSFNTIYNTADVLNLFIDIAPKDIMKYINKSLLGDFYKSSPPLANSLKNILFHSKALTLTELGGNVSYGNIKNFTGSFKNNKDNIKTVSEYLQDIYSNFMQVKPVLKTSFLIKFKNLQATF